MGRLQKPTPLKHCAHCGKQLERKRFPNGDLESLLHFNRRKFCDQKCMGAAFDARPVKADPSWATAHYHARKLVPPGSCSKCGRPDARDVHHKDENFQNNDPKNLERICRSCHMKEHAEIIPCVICGEPQKGLGYCNKHYIRLKKYGDPLASLIPPRQMCSVCGEPAKARGLCGKHYMQAKRAHSLSRKEV